MVCGTWKVRPIPARARSAAPSAVTGSPASSTFPAEGACMPEMTPKSVVLPEPFGPMMPRISPGWTVSVTSSSTLGPP